MNKILRWNTFDPSLLIVGTNAAGVGTANELDELVLVIGGGGATKGTGCPLRLNLRARRPRTPAVKSEVNDLRNEAEEGRFYA